MNARLAQSLKQLEGVNVKDWRGVESGGLSELVGNTSGSVESVAVIEGETALSVSSGEEKASGSFWLELGSLITVCDSR